MSLQSSPSNAFVTVHADAPIGPVHRRIFGAFVEQAARGVYTGLYEPTHPTADEHGFRGDVAALVRELGVTAVRYPGGNQVSGYRWEDGVGPSSSRPVRRELAWLGTETNAVGTDEIARWAERLDLELMLAVNLGTRGLEQALDLVEYVNGPPGSTLADLRASHGHPDPYGVALWFLGNEMDGDWQIGALDADEYGRLALRVARALHKVDPRLELAVCGSSWIGSPTYLEWDRVVLEHTWDEVGHLSYHAYFQPRDGDLTGFLAAGADLDDQLAGVYATIDHVRHRRRSRRTIPVSLDEWNVWYQGRPPTEAERDDAARLANREWPTAARQLEDVYTVVDAVVVGSLLITLLRHADRLTSANLAQLVNVIAPIMTEPGGPAWRQTIFHPFAATARLARGQVLTTRVTSGTYSHERLGEVATVDAVATTDETGTTVFAVNRDLSSAVTVTVDLRSAGASTLEQALYLHDGDLAAANTREAPDRVTLRPLADASLHDGLLTMTLPPVSWAAATCRPPAM
ncbi:alpha-N-arabinofuranosidase [Promicromonospora sp. AC04]|uniref:alpha-N-arabinofuranosidase n=1 Tax=Promicromonospora sp. AC04 TaxID=2135723 RepID=UPI000D33866F|nr:alpha-L-arabinofuranosidase C-terminal domain-containing protein [Promicromonospora sp. AC04]PUB27593.1 alpha-N-arabinofuranosidase [Promicromonospora sp. AC04]